MIFTTQKILVITKSTGPREFKIFLFQLINHPFSFLCVLEDITYWITYCDTATKTKYAEMDYFWIRHFCLNHGAARGLFYSI